MGPTNTATLNMHLLQEHMRNPSNHFSAASTLIMGITSGGRRQNEDPDTLSHSHKGTGQNTQEINQIMQNQ